MAHFTQTRDYFYSPKIEHFSHQSSSLELIKIPFPISYTPNHELMHNSSPKMTQQSVDCTNRLQKFSTIRSQVLGPIKRPFKASINSNIYKTLKQSVTSSRMKPLPHGVCRKLPKPVPTRCPRRVEQLSFSARRIPTVRSPGILERRYTFSL